MVVANTWHSHLQMMSNRLYQCWCLPFRLILFVVCVLCSVPSVRISEYTGFWNFTFNYKLSSVVVMTFIVGISRPSIIAVMNIWYISAWIFKRTDLCLQEQQSSISILLPTFPSIVFFLSSLWSFNRLLTNWPLQARSSILSSTAHFTTYSIVIWITKDTSRAKSKIPLVLVARAKEATRHTGHPAHVPKCRDWTR